MAGELFRKNEANVIRYSASVPDNIRAEYQRMFSEMPRPLYEATITHYGTRGGEIGVAQKIREFNPGYKPFFVGYTRSNPPITHVQFTGRKENMEVRSYDDRKRNLFHEVGHNVYESFAQQAAASGRNFRAEFSNTYSKEIEAMRSRIAAADQSDPPKTKEELAAIKPVADYFMPNGTFDRMQASVEAFSEIMSYATNGGVHSFNREGAPPVNVDRDLPESAKLVREATAAYIDKYDPAKAQVQADAAAERRANQQKPATPLSDAEQLERMQKSNPDMACAKEGALVVCRAKPKEEAPFVWSPPI